MALLDLEEPWKVLRRSEEWVLGPRADYERIGDVSDVVFVTGATVNEEITACIFIMAQRMTKSRFAMANMDAIREYIMMLPGSERRLKQFLIFAFVQNQQV